MLLLFCLRATGAIKGIAQGVCRIYIENSRLEHVSTEIINVALILELI